MIETVPSEPSEPPEEGRADARGGAPSTGSAASGRGLRGPSRLARMARLTAVLLVAGVVPAGALSVTPIVAAHATPATPVPIGSKGSATKFTGQAVDMCTAPTTTQMTAWLASPYRAVAVYVGGVNRGCAQPQLTAPWVATVSAQGWRLVPVYVGLQPSCVTSKGHQLISTKKATATTQGSDAAKDAVAQMTSLGLLRGSAVYLDIEHYTTGIKACTTSTLAFISGWTDRLHRLGYLAGVYGNLTAVAVDLKTSYPSTSYARPDALWIARWDGATSLKGWKGVSDTLWSEHQRIKQYAGPHDETWNGVKINVDSNQVDAPVATVALWYTITGTTAAARWSRPTTKKPSTVKGTLAVASAVSVVCQITGTTSGGTKIWNRLVDGTYVNDASVSTSSATGYTSRVPRCAAPWQVKATTTVARRKTAKATAKKLGTLRPGALVWTACQVTGGKVKIKKTTGRVWDRLAYSSGYVYNGYVAAPSSPKATKGVPACV